ncbi:unnamed protein product [Fusarium equiseti]|uniref:Uncharacterized protein n=1 Tax=Fusarium equiseti TaxID=61235 RepID=A0A8J2IXD5_FUSEQ|nr:unnamed protein product [Fusarium equiseti]
MENLFALNPALHGLMDKAFVAFEVFSVGERPDGRWDTTLKFHFLPVCKTYSVSSPRTLEGAIEILDDLFDQAQRAGLPAREPPKYPRAEGYIGARLKSGEWLRSGHLFPITHANQKAAELCATFFRWQWACARIWCISGGAEPQELRGGDDDDDDGWKLPVQGPTDDLQQDVDADAGGLPLGPAPPVPSPATARPARKLPQFRASGSPVPLPSDSPVPATPRPARKFPHFRASRSPVSLPHDSPSPDFSPPSRKGGFRDFLRRFSKTPQAGGSMEAPEPGRGPPTPAPMEGEPHSGGTIERVSTRIRGRVSDLFGGSREDVSGGNV